MKKPQVCNSSHRRNKRTGSYVCAACVQRGRAEERVSSAQLTAQLKTVEAGEEQAISAVKSAIVRIDQLEAQLKTAVEACESLGHSASYDVHRYECPLCVWLAALKEGVS